VAMIIGRIKLATLATIDNTWRKNRSSSEFGTKFQKDEPLFWRYPQIPFQHNSG